MVSRLTYLNDSVDLFPYSGPFFFSNHSPILSAVIWWKQKILSTKGWTSHLRAVTVCVCIYIWKTLLSIMLSLSNFLMLYFCREVPKTETYWFPVALRHLMAMETWSGDQSYGAFLFSFIIVHLVFYIQSERLMFSLKGYSMSNGPHKVCVSVIKPVCVYCSVFLFQLHKRPDVPLYKKIRSSAYGTLFVAWLIYVLLLPYYSYYSMRQG